MYEEFVKLAQENLKPWLKLAENNTALTVKLLQTQSDNAVELLQNNLAHLQTLVATNDLNDAVTLQQKYAETLTEKMAAVSRENTVVIEDAVKQAGNIFEGSLADVQAQARKNVENIEKEITRATTKAA
jgi:hypothetical protein